MSFELFQQGPSVYLPIFFLSLVATMVAYGLFPLIFAITRKKTISKRKYLIFCFGFNFIVAFLFQISNTANLGIASFVPYYLWTRIFSARGLIFLETHGILEGYQYNWVNIDESDTNEPNEDSEDSSPDHEESVPEQEESLVELEESSPEIEELVKKSEDTKTQKEKFCKHCGNVLNSENTHCLSCGKWFFAFRKRYIVYLFLVIFIASLATTTVVYHSKYTHLSKELKNTAHKNQELLQKIDQLNQNSLEEYNKGYEDGRKTGYDDGYDEGQSEGYDERYVKGKSQADTPKITYPSYSTSDEPSCAIPSCNNSPQRNSFYCFKHECMDVSCHNQKANDLCFYCINHKCAAPNCNSGQAFDSIYCYVHK